MIRRRAHRTARPFLDPLSWAGGVMDVCGRFAVRENSATERWSCTIEANVAPEVARELTSALDGGKTRRGVGGRVVWYVPASQQERVAKALLPRMVVQVDGLTACLQFRWTQLRKGRRVSDMLKRYRRRYVERTAGASREG